MTGAELKEWIGELARTNKMYAFYKSKEWARLRANVLRKSHGECVWCMAKGKVTKAETVHHIQHVRTHPELALSETYTGKDGRRHPNLVPLCHDCHDKAHGRMKYKEQSKKETVTPERW